MRKIKLTQKMRKINFSEKYEKNKTNTKMREKNLIQFFIPFSYRYVSPENKFSTNLIVVKNYRGTPKIIMTYIYEQEIFEKNQFFNSILLDIHC